MPILQRPKETLTERLARLSAEYELKGKKPLADMTSRLSLLTSILSGNNPAMEAVNIVNPLGFGTIKAFHGSPYRFKQFIDEATGKGEGAQAFGYGHYFSNKPTIAKEYAKMGARRRSFDANIGLRSESFVRNNISYSRWYDEFQKFIPGKGIKKITKEEFFRAKKEPKAYIYKVHLFPGKKPSQYNLLEWDKTASKDLKEKIKKQLIKENKMTPFIRQTLNNPKNKGSTIYKNMSFNLPFEGKSITPEARKMEVSKLLKRAGIDGIKYPSGTLSGIGNSAYSNYVIFDPKDIIIKRRQPQIK
jgi:hypothetical protein